MKIKETTITYQKQNLLNNINTPKVDMDKAKKQDKCNEKLREESIQLLGNPEFMRSYKKAKEQIKKRDFVDLNEL